MHVEGEMISLYESSENNVCIRSIIDTRNNIYLIINNENYHPHFLFATSDRELYSKIDGIRTVLRIHFVASCISN